jgi:large subunit ribosomal protein L22
MIEKLLHSAMTAASLDTDVDKLYVAKAFVDDGPRRRWRLPRARGYATPILHRMSHITITLSDEEEG